MLKDTELRLLFWRDGSTQAERLAAAVLRLSGYEAIDPQSPLGGPDGKKDILCRKGGLTWVGAVYFPTGPTGFTAIKKKYRSDLMGSPAEHRGFVFVTNQTITPGQRRILEELATGAGKEFEIVHLQTLQTSLDSAAGYGTRIQYLRIPMTIEEQLSWASDSDTRTAKALEVNTRELLALKASVERLTSGQAHILQTISQVAQAVPASEAIVTTPDLLSVSSFFRDDDFTAISAVLNPELVLLFHRLACFDLPSRIVGRLRTSEVWLGNMEGVRATHIEPPPAGELETRLSVLCEQWRANYPGLRARGKKLEAVASFHAALLALHPFQDGNGRAARTILMQQCIDLFGRADMSLMNRGAEYYMALKNADGGNFASLVKLIEAIIA